MTKLTAQSLAPRALCSAAAFLLFAACEPHDARTTRAFWDPDYEHQLHEQKVIPQHERFYFAEAAGRHDPVMRTNLGDPRDYESVFREMQPRVPANVAGNVYFPEAEAHGHGKDHGKGHEKDHGKGHAEKPGHHGAGGDAKDETHLEPYGMVPPGGITAGERPGPKIIPPNADAPHAVDPHQHGGPGQPVIPEAKEPAATPLGQEKGHDDKHGHTTGEAHAPAQERRTFFPPGH